MTAPGITNEELEALISRMGDAAHAYMNGGTRRYLSLFDHPDDFTLMPPYGGETSYGFTATDEEIEATSRFFASAEVALDVEATYASGDLVVLVAIERQRGLVGDFPEQDWSLRVTVVFRRAGDRWQIVHRHADPLVEQISMEHLAELARGPDAASPPTVSGVDS